MLNYNIIAFPLLLLLGISCNDVSKLHMNEVEGRVFGTTYSIKFISSEPLDNSKAYNELFFQINQSMSTYIEDSDISRINKGDTTVVVDNHFINVLSISQKIYHETNGVFDPTIGILVNAWDFGPEAQVNQLDSIKVKEMLNAVGLNKIELRNKSILKKNKNTFIDFNSLAKGYAVDIISDLLETKNVQNYLVEIGGEIRAKGINMIKQKPWRIGVEDPNFDGSQSYSKVISLRDEAMATSGSYRKFKLDGQGNRYAHIIDPKTGYPHRSNLLSVSVLAPTCIEADAYATALMSMGLEGAISFLEQYKQLKGYLCSTG